ncbi:dihydrofolate reductase family protein [Dactylosporangium sp. NPDC050588]|uniref:dihydrofolate reductase family protein n=1 Tax=Dactylosporangium sp. NPDC050588 TaxID=3157211 RepID=UPI0033D0F5C6
MDTDRPVQHVEHPLPTSGRRNRTFGGFGVHIVVACRHGRAALFDTPQRMVFGATTFRENAEIMSSGIDPHTLDEWNVRTMRMPATVISSTLRDTLGWPDATIVSGDAVDIVKRLKEESDVPLRSQASLSLNRALMAAGLVDRLQVTIFPVISGLTGTSPILKGRRRLRPRAAREPDPRRAHPGARVPADPPAVRFSAAAAGSGAGRAPLSSRPRGRRRAR